MRAKLDSFRFRLSEAKANRDEAMDRVSRGASEEWKQTALTLVQALCQLRSTFTADDVWEAGLQRPREPRALGPVMKRAQGLGYCEFSGQYVLSRQPKCHAHPRQVWRSLIHTGAHHDV